MTDISLWSDNPGDAGFDPNRLARVRAVLERGVANGDFPGAVGLVARHGKVVFWEAVGERMVAPERRPMEKDTIFDLASVTKAVATGTAIMLLVERGLIHLEDRVQSIIPGYQGRWKADTTVRHLLTHTSGLPLKPELHHDYGTPELLWQAIYDMPLLWPPGQDVFYTCLGYHLLGNIVEKVTGLSLDSLLHENVFGPLAMNDTGYQPLPDKQERAAATELCKWRRRLIWGEVHDENCAVLGGISGNAGLFSTAWDLAIFGTMLLREGDFNGARILGPLTVREMLKNQTPGLPVARGLGWALGLEAFGDILRPLSVGHTGWTGTSLCLCPGLDLVAILLTNRVHPGRENNKIDRARILFHNAVAGALIGGLQALEPARQRQTCSLSRNRDGGDR